MSKKILGLDLGTNSIGWALIDKDGQNILGIGSRIIPMSQDTLGKFDSGVSLSQTAERTGFRSIRRLRERHLLRRERLHRVLHILNFLPEHYAKHIDFDRHPGQFKDEAEPKLAYFQTANESKSRFYFSTAFAEMLKDFEEHQPDLVANGKKVPYDWTIYYLRQKALRKEIDKEELAWLLLQFNQKRGYYQLRGEEGDEENPNEKVEFYQLEVVNVEATEEKQGEDIWYNIHLANGWIYKRRSKIPLDWIGKTKEFIVTTELNEDGSEKVNKDGNVKRKFRAPAENDWTLVKKKTEYDIEKSGKHVGEFIYENLLANPHQKIKGKLVRVIERGLYKKELEQILDTQVEFHPELKDNRLYNACVKELYKNNEAHRGTLSDKGFKQLLVNDIIFYQRPLRSKKSLIANCKFEVRNFRKDGQVYTLPLKGIAKSHPLYQEFRIWQFIQNLKILRKETANDIDVTQEYVTTFEKKTQLFDWMNNRKEVKQDALLKQVTGLKKVDGFRWNYIDSKDKAYPGNETRGEILSRLKKAGVPDNFLSREIEEDLWHILYSVEDRNEITKALTKFSNKHSLGDDFVEVFKKFPQIEKEYGAYSAKALKKLLPLMRLGKYWSDAIILTTAPQYQANIQNITTKIIQRENDLTEDQKVKGKSINQKLLQRLLGLQGEPEDYQGLDHYLASYLVYGRHSEDSEAMQWRTPGDIEHYLQHIFKQHALRNPIVEKVIRETLKVVKDIWIHFGQGKPDFFDEIHVELGREMKNPAEVRKEMTARMGENENTNLRIKALLTELLADDVEGVRPYSPMQQEILKIYEEGVLSSHADNLPDDIAKISKLSQPSGAELKKYKLWLEQGYRSPYTGKMIPLNKLFTRAYDIEHIIPQSRYFDDSLSNKVICETEVNSHKDNWTGFAYMKQFGGSVVPDTNIRLLTLSEYEDQIKRNFSRNKAKARKLLMEDIPEEFIERQLNDSRYISKVVKGLLSNIVREEGEQEAISKRVVPITGAVTSQMKLDWGLENIWNDLIAPRFQRLNAMRGSTDYGETNPNTNKFLPRVPLVHQKGFSKKRIDHRHHALDALVIACITKDHVNYLHSLNSERKNYGLVSKLRLMEECIIRGEKRLVPKAFKKPWDTFTQEAKQALEKVIVSFKQNNRIVTKTNNYYEKWVEDISGSLVKKKTPQLGENKAIRRPLHKDTVSGLVILQFSKTVSLSSALETPDDITNKSLRKQVINLKLQGYNKKQIFKYFKELNFIWDEVNISRTDVSFWDVDNIGLPRNAANRVPLNETFNSQMIKCVTDSGIQKILKKHLSKYDEVKDKKVIEHPELAFSPDGIDAMNQNLANKGDLNAGKFHQPIYKVRTFEPRGNKFMVGQVGNKKNKFVETAKGTNLFFGIYQNASGLRTYETIPLNIAIERKKQGLPPVPERNDAGAGLLMYLSPNDLVYVPAETSNETERNMDLMPTIIERDRIYKIVSFTNNRLYGIPYFVAKAIVDKGEFTQLNKLETSLCNRSIKEHCTKLKIDRLGNIEQA